MHSNLTPEHLIAVSNYCYGTLPESFSHKNNAKFAILITQTCILELINTMILSMHP